MVRHRYYLDSLLHCSIYEAKWKSRENVASSVSPYALTVASGWALLALAQLRDSVLKQTPSRRTRSARYASRRAFSDLPNARYWSWGTVSFEKNPSALAR
jgi:hypothetical protein